VHRARDLGITAELEPLTYHAAELHLKDKAVPLTFDLQAQNWLESLRFVDGSGFKEVSHGKGRIFWISYPAELAQGLDPAASVYAYVLNAIGLASPFELRKPLSAGVLIFPTILEDSILYVMISDSAEDAQVDFVDHLSHAHVSLRLPSQRAALALIRRSDGEVRAKYGF